MNEVVDKFIVVESEITHSGKPKPLFFCVADERFAPWRDKIHHYICGDMPLGSDNGHREFHQRNMGLVFAQRAGATNGDTIITSDLDEIMKPSAVRSWSQEMGPMRFEQIMAYGWLNCVCNHYWGAARISTVGQLMDIGSVQLLRHSRIEYQLIRDGGWHFSYMGGVDAIKSKLASFGHVVECDRHPYNTTEWIETVLGCGVDLFARDGLSYSFREPGDWLPNPVMANPNRWKHLLWPGTEYSEAYHKLLTIEAAKVLSRLQSHATTET